MQIIADRIKGGGKAGDKKRIYFLGDTHIGNIACHKALLERMVRQIADDPDGLCILMGDIVDAVAVRDKRFMESVLAPEVRDGRRDDIINRQIEMASELLMPMKGKIVCALIGNHEEKIVEIASADPMRIIAWNLNAPYKAAYCAYLRLAWAETKGHTWACNIVVHHGAGGGSLIGAKANRVERRAGYFPSADIVASGHVHARLYDPNHITLDARQKAHGDGMELVEHVTHCFLTGSTLKGYDHNATGSLYTERADLMPCALGGMYAEIQLHRTQSQQSIKINGGCYP